MIYDSRSVIYRAGQKNDPNSWLVELTKQRNINMVSMAFANKTDRIRLGIINPQKRVPTPISTESVKIRKLPMQSFERHRI